LLDWFKYRKQERTNTDGSERSEVVWVFFFSRGDGFAQMIGYNKASGKTAFLELKDG